jgi:hypothetical protein
MAMQTLQTLKKPLFSFIAVILAFAFGIMFFYFDEFLFFSPYLTLYLPVEMAGKIVLNTVLSIISGLVVSLSLYQLRNMPNREGAQGKMSASGIIAAMIAGACPCYYLVPLLAVAGGVGGILGAIGTVFYAYQTPIKLFSLALVSFVAFTIERSLRAYCRIDSRTKSL